MGNKLGRRKQVVDEKYTKPQGLYQHKDVDIKKLRKLILEAKLAPCYPGDEESSCSYEVEECPICFLYYPSLNRSRCCMKSICTECFLQMKVPNSTRPTQCPFCKTSNYGVEYRGVKTKEEKGLEQIEEQRVIEAKIRMQHQELQDKEEGLQKRHEPCSSMAVSSSQSPAEDEEVVSLQDSCATPIRQSPSQLAIRANRDDEFDMDLEEIMVMEAIWLSIQEKFRHKDPAYNYDASPSDRYATEDHQYVSRTCTVPHVGTASSTSGGLACTIAALAEHQHTIGETSSTLAGAIQYLNVVDPDAENYSSAQSSIDNVDRGPEEAEAGTGYTSSDATEDTDAISALPRDDDFGGSTRANTGPIIPTFEEQMMLAMAVSLAEARVMKSGPGASLK